AQRGAALLHRKAPGGLTLVRSSCGVAVDHLDALEVHVQLVGGDLRQGGADTLAQLDLAGEDRHGAVGLDAQPGVEHAVRLEAARQSVLAQSQSRSERESDDESSAHLQEVTAGNVLSRR